MDKKFKQIYYSDGGYWRGKIAIQRLAKASGSTKEEAERWLLKQPLYQIYLPAPKYVPGPNASMSLFAGFYLLGGQGGSFPPKVLLKKKLKLFQ